MIQIIASLVKDLRELTGAGMMDCKKALTEANGDIELAIKNMRKSGTIKAAKKASNITDNGVIITKIDGNYSVILEVNCQTDFVAKNASFQVFANKVSDVAITKRINNLEILKAKFEEERILLINRTGENINIRRIASLEGEILGSYQHGTRIGVIIAAQGANEKLVKQLAMHIAASKPEFVKPEEIPVEIIKKEYQVQLEIAMQSNKLKKIVDKIVDGRMKKFINEISLFGQPFIMDLNKSVNQLLKENNANVTGFIRFEIGEKI